MTDEELDEARAREAYKAECLADTWDALRPSRREPIIRAARLAREGWKPEDPILNEAKAISKGLWEKEEFNPDEWAVDKAIVATLANYSFASRAA